MWPFAVVFVFVFVDPDPVRRSTSAFFQKQMIGGTKFVGIEQLRAPVG